MLADIRFSFLAPFGLVSGTDQPHNGKVLDLTIPQSLPLRADGVIQ